MTELDKIDALLAEWGRFSREKSNALGYPTYSSIAAMIEMTKVFDSQRKSTGNTANGSQKRSVRPPETYVPARYMKIDGIVAKAPNKYQQVIRRAYLYGQPDRIAARELKMAREDFTGLRESALEFVLRMLAR